MNREKVETSVSAEAQTKQTLRQWQAEINTSIPATIIKVDDSTVDIRLDITRNFDGTEQTPITVLSCAVIYPRASSSFGLTFPLAVGMTGLALFAQRDIDRWLEGDGLPGLPATARLHALTDAVFLPGLLPDGASLPDAVRLDAGPTALVIASDGSASLSVADGAATLVIGADGAVTLASAANVSIQAAGALDLAAAGAVSIKTAGALSLTGAGLSIVAPPDGGVKMTTPGSGGDDLLALIAELAITLSTISASGSPATTNGAVAAIAARLQALAS